MTGIDVVVPCYGYGRYLRQCVESVLSQGIENIRVLIIDDASPDNTADIAEQIRQADARVDFIRHPENRGHVATYNEGISWTRQTYMLLLSADDYLLPGALRRTIEIMDGNSEVSLSVGRALELVDADTAPHHWKTTSGNRHDILDGPTFINLSGARNTVATATAVVRTAVQRAVGGYRAELPHAGDMEMWLRIAAHGGRVAILDSYQAVYRRHSKNMSLSYQGDGWLRDLAQRKLALSIFFREHGHLLPPQSVSERTMMFQLALDAVGFASVAFNDGRMHACDELSRFAFDLSPGIRRSRHWLKLKAKRLMGRQIWQLFAPAFPRAHRNPQA